MDAAMRQQVDMMKAEMVKAAGFMRQANATIPVQGERRVLPLKDRNMNVVFYKAQSVLAPLVLGFHGGGFLFGGAAMDDDLWAALAEALDVNVISVDYRMAPDFRYPAPIEDAYDSAVYLRDHADEYGFDPAHISVMGSSAGANIAAALCLYVKDRGGIRFDQQILVYPFLDAATDPLEKGYDRQEAGMYYVFNELYTSPERAKEPRCSPRFASDEALTGLPRAIICPAEQDILCIEGCEYAARLQALGTDVSLDAPAKGMPHGYFEYGLSNGGGMETSFLPDAMKEMLANGTMQAAARNTLAYIKAHFIRG